MTPFDLERAVANHAEALWKISIALNYAGNAIASAPSDNATALITRELADETCEPYVSPATIVDTIVALAALFAAKTGSSPQQLFEQLWKDAPTDQWWHERTRPTRGDNDG